MKRPYARILTLPSAWAAADEWARLSQEAMPRGESRAGDGACAPGLVLKMAGLRRSDLAALRRAAPGASVVLTLSPDADTALLEGRVDHLRQLAAALDPPLGPALQRPLDATTRLRPPTPCGRTTLAWGQRTYVMGIINMTHDSFSGDGLGGNAQAALARGRQLAAEGADLLDVGGESSRPAHTYGERPPVGAAEEIRRVIPAVRLLASELALPISIDTTKPEVARAALDAGASLINDVWGLAAHPEMLTLAAERRVPIVLMHNQAHPRYDDLMTTIVDGLARAIERALAVGVEEGQIIVDPGFGFGKQPAHNLELTARLGELRSLGRPILYGSSRKSTIGAVLDLPPDERLEGTAATVALAVANGADIVRVHDVGPLVRVARMADAVVRETWRRST